MKSNQEKLAELKAELARQDQEFTQVRRVLQSLGDVTLRVPTARLDEIEEATRSLTTLNTNHNGLRV